MPFVTVAVVVVAIPGFGIVENPVCVSVNRVRKRDGRNKNTLSFSGRPSVWERGSILHKPARGGGGGARKADVGGDACQRKRKREKTALAMNRKCQMRETIKGRTGWDRRKKKKENKKKRKKRQETKRNGTSANRMTAGCGGWWGSKSDDQETEKIKKKIR